MVSWWVAFTHVDAGVCAIWLFIVGVLAFVDSASWPLDCEVSACLSCWCVLSRPVVLFCTAAICKLRRCISHGSAICLSIMNIYVHAVLTLLRQHCRVTDMQLHRTQRRHALVLQNYQVHVAAQSACNMTMFPTSLAPGHSHTLQHCWCQPVNAEVQAF